MAQSVQNRRKPRSRKGRNGIKDEFDDRRDISRQRRHQLRKQRDGICMICTERAVHGGRCRKHWILNAIRIRESIRRRHGYKKRYLGGKLYRLPIPN
jgi:hypothetical protein